MNFFKAPSGAGRNTPHDAHAATHSPADHFAGQGFIYYETVTSPDGALLVLNGYSGGEKGPTLIEPRVVVAATGRILFDLWNTYQHYSLKFSDETHAELRAENTHNGKQRVAEIDFAAETFALQDNPLARHPLARLSEMISLHVV